MKELLKRTLSGAIFVLLIVLLLGIHVYGMIGLLLLINIWGLIEFYNLSYKLKVLPYKPLGLITGSLLILLSSFTATGIIEQKYLVLSVAMLFLVTIPPLFYQPSIFFHSWGTTILGLFYISLPLSVVPFISFLNGYYEYRILLSVFILIWIYDSFAYLTGKGLGKHKIFPSISPKKTWEGFAGGLIFAVFGAYILHRYFMILDLREWIFLSIIIVISGTLGDFIESAIKRNAGVKDSGKFMPGHGGVLDRFDSFIFSVPFIFTYLYILKF